MRNERWYLCFDFECDSPDPDTCNPVELAAVPIDPRSLEIHKDKAFNAIIRPDDIDKDEYFTEDRQKTIKWHAETQGMTEEEVVTRWKTGKAEKVVWKNFCKYCAAYNIDKRAGQWYTEPIPVGYNIIGYDIPIAKRLAEKHKTKMPFSTVNKVDMQDNMFMWLENLDEPNNYKMDTLREWLAMPKSKAHEAFADVLDEAMLFTRFLKFHRRQARADKFRGSFA